ncbi:MAG: hypothetical protein HZA08_01265 [Nitrospirae bacterium]|nr:hypothetical protein [Nitrospirota bacterium]
MNSHEPGFTNGNENQRDKNVPPILIDMDRRGFLTPPEGFSSEFNQEDENNKWIVTVPR